MTERIQKVLANAGYGSRREIERWIEQGRIKVNQNIATLGDRIDPEDRVFLDGKPLTRLGTKPKQKIIVYHKPIGEICSRQDPEGRPTIFDHLPTLEKARWITVGRLDINTVGLILLTTDGELANRLMHPSAEVEREYAVRVMGDVSPEIMQRLQRGVELEDGMAKFDRILDSGGSGRNHWYHVILKEGRNREVRRLWEAVGLTVSRLLRVRYGPIVLERSLRPGKWRALTSAETDALYQVAGLQSQADESNVSPHRHGGRKKSSRHTLSRHKRTRE
ncbi:MAG: pseudouridine synthase [Proteobacteria bacterium]|nr:pseudouridine synthase [Pseudomonadota bacterium]